ncbi:MAG: glucosaminidase domain-containing protein [Desulfuromonadaceae bacterium]|nr:glucosaminidase domain-containing protein [Desulfuromonadaceae bacterium]
MTYRFSLLTLLLTFFLLCGCDISLTPSAQQGPQLKPHSFAELQQWFDELNYHWETLDQGVPLFQLQSLPNDLHQVQSVRLKKKLFFLSLLPMVLFNNEQIRAQRRQLKEILAEADQTGQLSERDQQWLEKICRQYKCKGDPLTDKKLRSTLLGRVDIVPPELVLAQAANESGYGTSRFARQANNLFGEWTFTPGTGLVPKGRPEGARYEVRIFKDLMASIRSYMSNLNTHPAYQELRRLRRELRKQGLPLSGNQLAAGLRNYSTRRDEYVDEIREMIRHNRLCQVADLGWRDEQHLARRAQDIFPNRQLSARPQKFHRLSL